jgi:hypothetical protein
MSNGVDYSNAMGYGLFCGKRCVLRKMEAGIPPHGAKRVEKMRGATADNLLAQAALEKTRKAPSNKKWTPLAVAGVVGASFLGIALMVVIIRKNKK